jgi:S1-C subfamily serine protease
METTGNRTTLVIVIVALVALLVGCCCGVLIGGLGVGLFGVRSAVVSEGLDRMPELDVIPLPGLPNAPEAPEAPAAPGPELRGLSGAFVRDVAEGSPADRAGVRPSDFILAVDNTPLDANHPLAEVLSQYEPGDRITLTLMREGSDDKEEVTARLTESASVPGKAYLGVWFMDVTPGD